MINRFVAFLVLYTALLLGACSTVPEEAITANTALTQAIEVQQANLESAIQAWAKPYYDNLAAAKPDVSQRALNAQRKAAPDGKLTNVQIVAIFQGVDAAYNDTKAKIDAKVDPLLQAARANGKMMADVNSKVTAVMEASNQSVLSVQAVIGVVGQLASLVFPPLAPIVGSFANLFAENSGS